MGERADHEELARALLSRENLISEERYSAYRRRLDARLVSAFEAMHASWLPRSCGQRLRCLASVAALLLILAAGTVPRGSRLGTAEARKGPVLFTVRQAAQPTPEELPYEQATFASCVAVARTGPPTRRGGTDVYPLRLEQILKDETGVQRPSFACVFEGDAPAPAEERPYVVFLDYKTERGWTLGDMRRLDRAFEQDVLPGVRRCVELLEVARSNDPLTGYERLLAPEAGGLDEPARCVLTCRPDPRSGEVLLVQLRSLHERLLRPAPIGRDTRELSWRITRLAEVLARLREPRAAVLVAECVRRFPAGEREAYRLLPDLCRKADQATLSRVQRLLREEIDQDGTNAGDRTAARFALESMISTRQAR
jgi:hypothetical protein